MGGKDPEPAWEGGEVSGAGPAPPAAGTVHFVLRLPDGTVTLHPVAACRAELQCAFRRLVEEVRALRPEALCRQSGDGDGGHSHTGHWLGRPGCHLLAEPGGHRDNTASSWPSLKVFLHLNVASRLESQEQLSTHEHSVATFHVIIRNL